MPAHHPPDVIEVVTLPCRRCADPVEIEVIEKRPDGTWMVTERSFRCLCETCKDVVPFWS